MRIVFMGSPSFAVPSLEALINSGYNVIAVYTQPDRPAGRGRALLPPAVKVAATVHEIPVYQPASLKGQEETEKLRELQPDAVIVCAYGQILPQAVIDVPPWQCLNVHFSLLPRHRGASPVAAAILAGDAYTGVTIQLVRMKLDTGPVLAAAQVPILPYDTTIALTEKLAYVGAGVMLEALGGWLRGEREPRPQDEAGATYIGQISKDDGIIDWTEAAEQIWRKLRAYHPWPGTSTQWREKTLKILSGEVIHDDTGKRAGTVVETGERKNGIGVQTGRGILKLDMVQMEGKKATAAGEFARGYREFVGSQLG